MRNRNPDIDTLTRAAASTQPIIDRLIETSLRELPTSNPIRQRTERRAASGAMAQQCGDRGYHSAPQKFVHLVGCRESKS